MVQMGKSENAKGNLRSQVGISQVSGRSTGQSGTEESGQGEMSIERLR